MCWLILTLFGICTCPKIQERLFSTKTQLRQARHLSAMGGVLNAGPWGVQIRLNDGGVIFARRGKKEADLERIPKTYTNTENVYKYIYENRITVTAWIARRIQKVNKTNPIVLTPHFTFVYSVWNFSTLLHVQNSRNVFCSTLFERLRQARHLSASGGGGKHYNIKCQFQ